MRFRQVTALATLLLATLCAAACGTCPPCAQVRASPCTVSAEAGAAGPLSNQPAAGAARAVHSASTSTAAPTPGRRADAAVPSSGGRACVVGRVQTAGDLVYAVRKARVFITSAGELVGETSTDENGELVWCLDMNSGQTVELTLFVEKPPFQRAAQTHVLRAGQHTRVGFALEAPGLTDAESSVSR